MYSAKSSAPRTSTTTTCTSITNWNYPEVTNSHTNHPYPLEILYQALSTCLDWHIDPSAPISGFTQTSRTKLEGNDEIAYFAHPFEFDLYYKNDENIAEHTDLMPQMPRLLFEVASYDSWNRYRTEGYAWTQLPVKSSKSLHWIWIEFVYFTFRQTYLPPEKSLRLGLGLGS